MKTASEAKKEIGRMIARYGLHEIGTIEIARLVEKELEFIENDASQSGYERGVREAAAAIEMRKQCYMTEHGSYDPPTGQTEYPKGGDEYIVELDDIQELLLTLLNKPKESK